MICVNPHSRHTNFTWLEATCKNIHDALGHACTSWHISGSNPTNLMVMCVSCAYGPGRARRIMGLAGLAHGPSTSLGLAHGPGLPGIWAWHIMGLAWPMGPAWVWPMGLAHGARFTHRSRTSLSGGPSPLDNHAEHISATCLP